MSSARPQSLHSDSHNSDADIEDNSYGLNQQKSQHVKSQRQKERSKHRAIVDDDDDNQKVTKVRRKKPTTSDRKASKTASGSNSSKRNSKPAAPPVVISSETVLQQIGDGCEWNDALLALGTKELNEVLRKGNFTHQQMQELKAARRRAKNRTYALRSRQKKGGKDQTPCPGPTTVDGLQVLAGDSSTDDIALSNAKVIRAKMRAKKAALAANGSEHGDSNSKGVNGNSTHTADEPFGTESDRAAIEAASAANGLDGELGHHDTSALDKMYMGSDDDISSASDVDGLNYFNFLSDTQSDTTSDTGHDTDWGSSTDASSQFDSEYDSVDSMDLTPAFELSAMTLSDPVSPAAADKPPPLQIPASVSTQPQKAPHQNELEAMLDDLRTNYVSTHNKVDKYSNNNLQFGEQMVDGDGPKRGERCTTPTPSGETISGAQSGTADPLFVDPGFQSLTNKVDSWLGTTIPALSPPGLPSRGTMFDYTAPVMEVDTQTYSQSFSIGGTSYDHFMAATMGMGGSSTI